MPDLSRITYVIALGVSLLCLPACGDDDAAVCVPGTTQPCLGSGRCEGVQICEASGAAYGPCLCEGVDGGRSDGGLSDAGVDAPVSQDAGPDVFDAGISEELKAFPGAYGAGSVITGGRGGQVVPVTRLDDAFDGDEPVEGTLRYALTREFPRTIIFRVRGNIIIGDTTGDGLVDRDVQFPTMLYVSGDEISNVTVAGQTAPFGGVTIVGFIYGGGASNMIWRYIRVRKSNVEGEFGFPAVALDGSDDIIFDHMSVAYGSNESLNMGPRQMDGESRSSVQYNLIGLGNASTILGRITDGDTDQSVSFHSNFLSQLTHRTPNIAGDVRAEVINNLNYNHAFRLVNVHNGAQVNHINNASIAGPHTSDRASTSNKVHTGTEGTERARIYTAGNYISDFLTEADADNWISWTTFPGESNPAPPSNRVMTPFPMLGAAIPIRTIEDIRENLPDEVGAFRTLDENGNIQVFRDSVDELLIAEYRAGVETVYGYPTDPSGFVYPEIPSSEPYPDRDGDGMPDAWESANGFDPDLADDADDADGDGYTNLEEFLGLVDRGL
ncbi:MAG: hypothetical protein AB8H86_27345 [Polyangiales bacterium]